MDDTSPEVGAIPASTLAGSEAGASGFRYDVFLCHNRTEKPLIKDVAEALQLESGILFFLDEYSIPPSVEFMRFIRDEIRRSASCAIFIGPAGWGPTQIREARLARRQHRENAAFRIIPVLLPGGDEGAWGRLFGRKGLPFNWVKFTTTDDPGARTKIADAVRDRLEPKAAGPDVATPYLIRRQAALWDASGRGDPSLLFAGNQLAAAQRVAAADPVFVSPSAGAFLLASSQAERDATERRADEERQRAEAAERLLLGALAQALVGLATELAEDGPVPDDAAALVALEAYAFALRSGQAVTDRFDRAMRSALGSPHFGTTLPGLGAQVTALAFAPSGRWLATGAADGTVAVWDLAQCDTVHATLRRDPPRPHATLPAGGVVHWLAFSGDGDALVAVAGYGPGARAGTGQQPADYPVVLWSDWPAGPEAIPIGTATLLANNTGYPATPPFAVAASLDGTLFGFLGPRGFEVWRHGRSVPALIQRFAAEACRTVGFTRDNRGLVVVTAAGGARIRWLGTPSPVAETVTPRDWVQGVDSRGVSLLPLTSLSADGTMVAQLPVFRTSPGSVGVWALAGGEPPARVTPRSASAWNTGSVNTSGSGFVPSRRPSLVLDPLARRLALADGMTVRLWSMSRPDEPPTTIPDTAADCLAFSQDGRLLAMAAAGATWLWSLQPWDMGTTVLAHHDAPVRAVGFVGASQDLASFSTDGRICRWDLGRLDDGPVVLDLRSRGLQLASHDLTWWDASWTSLRTALPFPACFSQTDGRIAFPAVEDGPPEEGGTLLAWLDGDMTIETRPMPPTQAAVGQAWSQGGSRRTALLATAFADNASVRAVAYDLYTFVNASNAEGPIRKACLQSWGVDGSVEPARALAEPVAVEPVMTLFAEGRMLAAATNMRGQEATTTVRVWDLVEAPGAPRTVGRVAGFATAIACCGGTVLAVASGADIAVFDLARPGSDPVVLFGHRDPVRALAFNRDGSVLATGSEDRTIRLWRVGGPRARPVVLQGHSGEVTALAFHRDGDLLASGSADGTVRLWLASAEALAGCLRRRVSRTLTEAEWHQFVGPDIPFAHASSAIAEGREAQP